eukprot:ctg_1779.g513
MAHATESVRQALEQAVVAALEADGVIADTRTFCQTKDVEHEELVAVLNSMVRRDLVRLEALDAEAFYELTEEGQRYAEHGTPEHLLSEQLARRCRREVAAADTWRQRATIGMQQGIKQGVFRLDKSQKPPRLVLAVAADDGWQRIHKLCAALRALQDRHADQETTDAATWETALRRGLVIKRLRKAYRARPGARFAEARLGVGALQALQLCRPGHGAHGGWSSASAAESVRAVSADLSGDGLHRDGPQPLRGVVVLEFRRAVPATTASGAGCARHLLPVGAGIVCAPRGWRRARARVCRARATSARARRVRLAGVSLYLERGRGTHLHSAHAHHGGIGAYALSHRSGAAGTRARLGVHAAPPLLDRPSVPQRDSGCDAPGRVPPGRGVGGCAASLAGRPQGHHRAVLPAHRYAAPAFQAGAQPVHRAVDGDLRISSGAEQVGRDRQQRHLPTGDAAADAVAA